MVLEVHWVRVDQADRAFRRVQVFRDLPEVLGVPWVQAVQEGLEVREDTSDKEAWEADREEEFRHDREVQDFRVCQELRGVRHAREDREVQEVPLGRNNRTLRERPEAWHRPLAELRTGPDDGP